jgi:hypothetical protein
MMEDLLNVVRREAERVGARATTWSVGTIDSYDKATHAAKVKLQPEGTLSGWLPLNSLGVGSSFGVHIGPNVGDPVLVHFHEGDREAGVILGRFFTDKHPPVPVEEGEFLLQHSTKTKAFFKKDGSLLLQFEDKNTEILFDTDGSLVIKQDSGSQIKLLADGTVGVAPKAGAFVYLGGDGVTGSYGFVQTDAGVSINTKARVG